MEAFETVITTFMDEIELDLQNDPRVPTVYSYRNPVSLSIEYKDKTWQCNASYLVPTGQLHVSKSYSPELVTYLAMYYEKYYETNIDSQ